MATKLNRLPVSLGTTNCHLYHYAGNNPVRYVDPEGAYTIDDENGTIYCDMDDNKDMKAAQKEFSKNQNIFSCIATSSNSASKITFNDSKAMKNIIRKNNFDNMLKAIEDYSSSLSTYTAAGSFLADDLELIQVSNIFAEISSVTGYVVTLIDFGEAYSNPNFDTVSDFVIDVVGLMGPQGTAVSIYFAVSKKASMKFSEFIVRAGYEFEKYLLNTWSRTMVGVDIKK